MIKESALSSASALAWREEPWDVKCERDHELVDRNLELRQS